MIGAKDPGFGVCEPTDPRGAVEHYLRGDGWLHFKIGIWPGTAGAPDSHRAQFCTHIQRQCPRSQSLVRDNAVPPLYDFNTSSLREGEEWLQLPVFVDVVVRGQ